MATERKAHIVYFDPTAKGESKSLERLNALMNDGWLPVHTTAMGGAAAGTPEAIRFYAETWGLRRARHPPAREGLRRQRLQ